MAKVCIAGYGGKMGSRCLEMVNNHPDLQLVALLAPHTKQEALSLVHPYGLQSVPIFTDKEEMLQKVHPDIWIDFTTPYVVFEHALFALEHNIHPVIGTTGLTEEEIERLKEIASQKQIGGIIAPNFSLGSVLLLKFAERVAHFYEDVEIIEAHHKDKLNAPSGTAQRIAKVVSEEREQLNQSGSTHSEGREARGELVHGIPIHSIRLPGMLAHHEVIFAGEGELISVKHNTMDYCSYIQGVIYACRKVLEMKELVYGLDKIL